MPILKRNKNLSARFRPCFWWLTAFVAMVLFIMTVRSSTLKPSFYRVFFIALHNVNPKLFDDLDAWYVQTAYAPQLFTLLCIVPLVGLVFSLVRALLPRFKHSAFRFPKLSIKDKLRNAPWKKEPQTDPEQEPAPEHRLWMPTFPFGGKNVEESEIKPPPSPPKKTASPAEEWLKENQKRAMNAHAVLLSHIPPHDYHDRGPLVRFQDFSLSDPKDEPLQWDDNRHCVVSVGPLTIFLDYDAQRTPRILGAVQNDQTLSEDTFPLPLDRPLVIMRQEGTEPHVRCALTWIGGC